MSWKPGDPEIPPKVYLPQSDGEASPAYDTYADPAEAHGWQEGYDGVGDTAAGEGYEGVGHTAAGEAAVGGRPAAAVGDTAQERDAAQGPAADEPAQPWDAAWNPAAGDAAGRRDRLRRRRRTRLVRRLAVGAGAVCVVVLGAALSGAFDSAPSGRPAPAGRSGDDGAGDDSEVPVVPSAGGEGGGTDGATASGPPGGSASATRDATPSATATASSSGAPKTTASPSPTVTGASPSAPGNSNGHPGRGQGATKRPK
ncbi:hypothetical protein [Streptomyces sp. Tue6028]|uniref:hypothetical protein n=1 Tax=Streptomyces sp. Tue6028 TaxID=2036037 RepID=UPI003D74B9D7